jgi:hypothetical protein
VSDAGDVTALREGRFKLESFHMRLEENRPEGAVYEGLGRIDQDASHHLQFTLTLTDYDGLEYSTYSLRSQVEQT